jgi:hypothetical protein
MPENEVKVFVLETPQGEVKVHPSRPDSSRSEARVGESRPGCRRAQPCPLTMPVRLRADVLEVFFSFGSIPERG